MNEEVTVLVCVIAGVVSGLFKRCINVVKNLTYIFERFAGRVVVARPAFLPD